MRRHVAAAASPALRPRAPSGSSVHPGRHAGRAGHAARQSPRRARGQFDRAIASRGSHGHPHSLRPGPHGRRKRPAGGRHPTRCCSRTSTSTTSATRAPTRGGGTRAAPAFSGANAAGSNFATSRRGEARRGHRRRGRARLPEQPDSKACAAPRPAGVSHERTGQQKPSCRRRRCARRDSISAARAC